MQQMNYRVITFYLKSGNNKENFSAEQRKETKIVEKAVLKFLPKEYIFCNTNRIIYITRKIKRRKTGISKKAGKISKRNARSIDR